MLFRSLNATASGTAFEYTSITAGTAYAAAAKTNTFDISIGGGAASSFSIAFAGTETIGEATILVNAVLSQDSDTRNAGLYATDDGTNVTIQSSNGTAFRLNARTAAGAEVLGFGTGGAAAGTSFASTAADATNVSFFNNRSEERRVGKECRL